MKVSMAAAIVALLAPVGAGADDWPYDDQYDSALLFLHATLDYAFHPVWVRQWERDLVKGNGVRVTAGSVTTDDLLTMLQVDISQPVGHGFRVMYVANRNESVHRDVDDREQFVGFEVSVFGESGLQMLADPAGNKEELDVLLGGLLADEARERYLRLWLRLDDPVWGRKNDLGGSSVQEAIGPQWSARLARGRWQLFSDGRYSRPSERTFDDPEKSPVVAREKRRRGQSEHRVRWVASEGTYAEAELTHYEYEQTVSLFEQQKQEILMLRSGVVGGFPVRGDFRGRAEVHHVRQDAKARGAHDYDFERRDVPWAVHLEWLPTPSQVWDVGYLATPYEWDYVSRDGTAPYNAASSVDKLTLAWTFVFSENARALLSLSHEPEVNRFGGGNLQLQAAF